MSINDHDTINLILSIMLKNILNLDGAQPMSKNEQKSIKGSGPKCSPLTGCSDCDTVWETFLCGN